jgi:O-methyltransferase domain/Dimerisation domain
MNFGIIPETLRERLALRLGLVPLPIVDMLFGSMKARMIMVGVTLGLFEALRNEPHSAVDLADSLRVDSNALECLVRALAHAGYLVQRDDVYALSRLARRTLLRGAPMDITEYVAWHETQCRFLEHMETLVRTGTGIEFHRTLRDKRSWRDYQRAMLAMARLDAATIARLVPIRAGATHLLDLAGSHGLLGAAICRRHPPMRSTVVDLPEAVEEGRALARETGNADLVDHRAGDLRTDSLEECDAVLLANILHHFIPADITSLIARVRDALRPGGTVAIWDLESPQRGGTVGHGDVVSLFFRLTSSAGAYHGTDYANWLRDQRFFRVKVVRPSRSPGRVLVIGTT